MRAASESVGTNPLEAVTGLGRSESSDLDLKATSAYDRRGIAGGGSDFVLDFMDFACDESEDISEDVDDEGYKGIRRSDGLMRGRE